MGGGHRVEAREQVVQQADHPVRIGSRRPGGESGDIGEQHGRLGIAVGNAALAMLEPGGDRGGDRIDQQLIDPRLRDAASQIGVSQEHEDDGEGEEHARRPADDAEGI